MGVEENDKKDNGCCFTCLEEEDCGVYVQLYVSQIFKLCLFRSVTLMECSKGS
jgi:hypothetical protein